ncbi:MAG: hypothetical protein K0S56_562 [Microvirga sp.]|jgi:hypothetical protein|nr:hypothetical protein [Microvirga sp.]
MARLGSTFDSTQHDTEQRDFTPLPDGDYRLEITESDVAPTSKGTGTVLKATVSVIEPEEFRGRLVWANYNVENANATAQQIGQRELASLCRAIGIPSIQDSEELHFKAFTAKIGMSKQSTGTDGKVYEPRNEIKKYYFPDEGAVPVPAVSAGATAPPANDNQRPAVNDNRPTAAPAAVAGARPWGKK